MVKFAKLALAVALVTAVGSKAQAGFVPTYNLNSAVFNGSTTTLTYTLNFTTGGATGPESLSAGNFLTIYDVAPTAATAVTTPASFAFASTPLSTPPPFTMPTDSPSLFNVTYTYTGTTLTADTAFTVSFSVAGNFTGPTRTGLYASTDTLTPAVNGTNNQVGFVQIPTNAVPEPASLALVSLGLVGGFVGLRRRRTV